MAMLSSGVPPNILAEKIAGMSYSRPSRYLRAAGGAGLALCIAMVSLAAHGVVSVFAGS
jgi:hypothetical protein